MAGKLPPPPKPRLSQDSFSDVPPADRESLFKTLVGVEERITLAIDQSRAEYRAEIAGIKSEVAEQDLRLQKVEIAVTGIAVISGQISSLNDNVTKVIGQNAVQDTRIEALAVSKEAGGKAGGRTGAGTGVLASVIVAVLLKLWEALQSLPLK